METNNKTQKEIFALFFRNICIERSLTKAGLSRLSKVSEATLSRIETADQLPSPVTLKKLAPYLMVSEQELMVQAGYLDSRVDTEPPKSKLAYLLRSAEDLTPEDQEEIGDMLKVLIERRRAKRNQSKIE